MEETLSMSRIPHGLLSLSLSFSCSTITVHRCWLWISWQREEITRLHPRRHRPRCAFAFASPTYLARMNYKVRPTWARLEFPSGGERAGNSEATGKGNRGERLSSRVRSEA